MQFIQVIHLSQFNEASCNGQVSSQVPLAAPYMLSPPPRRQQCHHPAGSPKAGKHLQQGWHAGAVCSQYSLAQLRRASGQYQSR